MTGREQRWLDPSRGFLKLSERFADRIASRYIYPHLLGAWSPYSWQLPRRLCVTEGTLRPPRWPRNGAALRVLLLTDLHVGPFLKPEVLADVFERLMRLEPDLVALGGDLLTGGPDDLAGFLEPLGLLARAPLGAYFCYGNHEYFAGEPRRVEALLAEVDIRTLRNAAVRLEIDGASFVLGGIDDLVLGAPDWEEIAAEHGMPHLLLAHHPDHFYEAVRRGVALVLSGHTHGGQIRIPGGPPLVRQSHYCLDEGAYAHGGGVLVVSRGLGVSGLPWRFGARPEAMLLRVL